MGCHETTVRNYHSVLLKILEDCRLPKIMGKDLLLLLIFSVTYFSYLIRTALNSTECGDITDFLSPYKTLINFILKTHITVFITNLTHKITVLLARMHSCSNWIIFIILLPCSSWSDHFWFTVLLKF